MKKEKELLKFLFEVGQLKYVKRSGWWIAGVKDPESVAEHSFRAAIIGFTLAIEEGVDPYKIAVTLLFHDLPESRLQDLHKIAQRYASYDNEKILEEQVKKLPQKIKKKIPKLKKLKEKEEAVLHDADLLEVSIQAKEYYEQGYKDVVDWIKNAGKRIKTKTGKRLHSLIMKTNVRDWWKGLKVS